MPPAECGFPNPTITALRGGQAAGISAVCIQPCSQALFSFSAGTGIRGRAGPASVKIGGLSAGVLYARPQGEFAGLLNVLLPRALAGRGEVEVALSADGREATCCASRYGSAIRAGQERPRCTRKAGTNAGWQAWTLTPQRDLLS